MPVYGSGSPSGYRKKKKPTGSWSPSAWAPPSWGAGSSTTTPAWSPTTRTVAGARQPLYTRPSYTSAPRPLEQREERKAKPKQSKKPTRRTGPSLLQQLDRPFRPGETITPKQTALLAEAYGLPGITYSKAIVPGESGYQPGVRNPDDATPSLFQITPSVQSAATKAKFDKIASKHRGGYSNPVAAAKQAAFLAKGSPDEGVSNYVAFNPSAPQGHLPGGPARARKKLGAPAKTQKPTKVPSLIKIGKKAERKFGVEAREQPFFDPVDPVHTGGSMHYSGNAIDFQGDPSELSELNRWLAKKYGSRTSEMFYDPGINIAEGTETSPIGGHPSHVHFGLEPGDVGRRARSVYGVGSPTSGGTATGAATSAGGAVASGIQSAAQERSRRGRSAPLPTLPFAARAARPRVGDEEDEEIDPLTGEPIPKRYRPKRRRG